jgi:hypothetical protein
VGCALTKVVASGTLVPLALAGLVPTVLRLPRYLQAILLGVLAASGVYAVLMVTEFLPSYIAMAHLGLIGFGPESYELVTKYGATLISVWPQVARNVATVLMVAVSFRLMSAPNAAAMTFGLLCVLAFPFLAFVNFLCVIVALGLASIDDPDSLRRSRWLVLPTFVLAFSPMILTDETGLATGIVWALVVTGIVLVTVSSSAIARDDARAYRRPRALLVASAAVITTLALAASADGKLVLSSGWHQGGLLTPDVRDIWRAVRERTPGDALIFTDQTGRGPDILGGWNHYVLNGQRQVYIAGSTTADLQSNPSRVDARLKVNEEVLTGHLEPSDAATSRNYGSFFAVVSAARPQLPKWKEIYRNRTYVLYGWAQ